MPWRRSNECALEAGGARESAGKPELAKEQLGSPRRITISTVIEQWNIGEVERLLDWCAEQGFVFAAQSAQMEKMPIWRYCKIRSIKRWWTKSSSGGAKGVQPINGTPRTIETLLRFGDFQCYPTMFPRVYPNGDVFYPCEPLRKVAGNLLRDGSLKKIFARGKKIYGDIPPCQGSATCWKCAVALLRERLLGAGGRFYSLSPTRLNFHKHISFLLTLYT